MTKWIEQSTTITVQLGPALDATDGVTEETGLSPTVELSKNGAAFAARNSATAIAHDANGWYRVELDATDTNTLGRLIAKFDDAATHLPVWHEYMVVPTNVWDSFFGADALQVHVTEFTAGVIDATAIAANAITSTEIADNAITAAKIASDAITAAKIAADAIGASELATDAVNEIADGVLDRSVVEPSGIFTWPASLRTIIQWVGAVSRNRITQTATTQVVRNDANSADIASSTVSDDTTTFVRGEFS